MRQYASPRIGMTRHQGFVQGLNYFYIFFAIGKQGITWHGHSWTSKDVTVFGTIRIPLPADGRRSRRITSLTVFTPDTFDSRNSRWRSRQWFLEVGALAEQFACLLFQEFCKRSCARIPQVEEA
jgi:hypothetical protein